MVRKKERKESTDGKQEEMRERKRESRRRRLSLAC